MGRRVLPVKKKSNQINTYSFFPSNFTTQALYREKENQNQTEGTPKIRNDNI